MSTAHTVRAGWTDLDCIEYARGRGLSDGELFACAVEGDCAAFANSAEPLAKLFATKTIATVPPPIPLHVMADGPVPVRERLAAAYLEGLRKGWENGVECMAAGVYEAQWTDPDNDAG